MSVLTLTAILTSIGVVLASSALMYTSSSVYHIVYDDSNLMVEVRLQRINLNPQKFALAQTNVRITNNYEDDIHIVEFTVKAYNTDDPDGDTNAVLYGEQSINSTLIPAMTTTVVRQNVKIYNYEEFKDEDIVYGFYYLKWQNFGHEYTKLGIAEIDMDYWTDVFPLPS